MCDQAVHVGVRGLHGVLDAVPSCSAVRNIWFLHESLLQPPRMRLCHWSLYPAINPGIYTTMDAHYGAKFCSLLFSETKTG